MAPRGPTLVSFWHGRLGWMERLCIASVIAMGHTLALYTYGAGPIIDGVEHRDANEVIGPDDPAFLMKEGVQAFADLFRYELMMRQAGIWIDLDLYFLRPLVPTGDHLFGFEKPGQVNNAVLLLPPASPVLRDLVAFVRRRPIYAPWWRTKHKIRQRIAIAAGRPLPLTSFPKGQYGPKALTYFLRAHGKLDLAAPQDVFYPVAPQDHAKLVGSEAEVLACITPRTVAVHLWSNGVKRLLGDRMPPADSYLGRLIGADQPVAPASG